MNSNKVLIFGVVGGILIIVLVFISSFFINRDKDKDSIYNTETTLSFWGVSDYSSAYKTAISRFNTLYPNVKIDYRRFDNLQEYEKTLLDALASEEGPDIFVITNNDLPRKINKIFPLPSSKYTVQDLAADFPEIVENDFVLNENIYALPVFVDTLSLIYNKDIFNEAGIVFPPKTWKEFQNNIPDLTKFEDDRISQSGAAIGTANNIENYVDLLSLLMIQSGAEMVSEDYEKAEFGYRGSREALEFYLRFSSSESSSYTWDEYFSNDIESFAREKTAIVFGYHKNFKEIKESNPTIKAGVSEIPQIEGGQKYSFARYFGYTVSRQTKFPAIAWDFIRTLTTDLTSAESYLEATNSPPALKYLIERHKNDPIIGTFTKQILIAQNWKQPDPERVNEIFGDMINFVRDKEKDALNAILDAEREVTNLMRRSF
jgi:multiple sugar transport system substrate-binding protein